MKVYTVTFTTQISASSSLLASLKVAEGLKHNSYKNLEFIVVDKESEKEDVIEINLDQIS